LILLDASPRQAGRWSYFTVDGQSPVRRVPGWGPDLQSPYFKDLQGFYTIGGRNFVSGKQKRTIFEFIFSRVASDFTG
jgi:hypothetical protein